MVWEIILDYSLNPTWIDKFNLPLVFPCLPTKTDICFWNQVLHQRLGFRFSSTQMEALLQCFNKCYTPGSSNIAGAGKWGPRIVSMYFLLQTGIFQAAMLVYRRVFCPSSSLFELLTILFGSYSYNRRIFANIKLALFHSINNGKGP